jgi:hypothetical protein
VIVGRDPGAPIRDSGSIALVTGQLALVLLIIHRFQLESRTFFEVMLLVTAGFGVHALLPASYRLSFFVLLSLGSVFVALGALDGLCLIGLGLVLIGICNLPVRLAVRIGLLLASGGLFAVWRMGMLPAPWSIAIWPILGSMFMFRLALYLYVLRYEANRPTAAQTLAYFFMLPNVCFPLFPVVDYSTFVRTYYDREPGRIYETGMKWIVRGLIHLILYRFVYLQLTDPVELMTLGDLVQFMLATFLLYLRVSGQFHVIAGVLHLFGFRLPETHHLYYLASSFTDFWRRINIYWKDFMMKLVYYPSFFKLKGLGSNVALVGATAIVFLATWLLHSYQWFWLREGFPITPQDAVFWAILGTLVVFESLRDMKRPPKRRLGAKPAWSASLGLRTVLTFTTICVLWSLWTSDSIAGWLTMWMVAGNVAPGDPWLLAALLLGGMLIAGREWSVKEPENDRLRPLLQQPALHSSLLLAGVLLAGSTHLYARAIPGLASTVASLQRSTLNARDAALQHKGYYENLDNASRMSAQLWEVQARKPAHWVGLSATEAYRVRDDFQRADLRPGVSIRFLDQPLTTNRWGMRDSDSPREKPDGVYRIALLGPSHVMGSGVGDGETFADFLERRLNASAEPSSRIRFEVLNFGVAGFSLLQQLAMLEEKALPFEPDAVFFTDSPRAKTTVVNHLLDVAADGTAVPYPGLELYLRRTGVSSLSNPGIPVPFGGVRAALESAGLKTRMPWREAERRLRLEGDSIVAWTFGHMANVSHRYGIVPVFVALDNVADPLPSGAALVSEARAEGLLVFDLFGLWQGRDQANLVIASADSHPNATGNRLIAERLYELIQQHRSELRIETKTTVSRAAPDKEVSR